MANPPLALLSVLGLTLSGCVGPTYLPAPEVTRVEPPDRVVSFEASYLGQDGQSIKLRLQSAERVFSLDGSHQRAYRLDIQYGGEWTVFLDGNLNQVRVDLPCTLKREDGNCSHHLVDFRAFGGLPPMGVGLARLVTLETTSLPYGVWTDQRTAALSVTDLSVTGSSATSRRILITNATATEYSPLAIDGEYQYRDRELAPALIRWPHEQGPKEFLRTEYTEGTTLPRLAAWSAPKVLPAVHDDLPFPDADRRMMDQDFSPKEALEWLLSSSPRAKESLTRGCLKRFAIMPDSLQTGVASETTTAQVTITIGPLNESRAEAFHVRRTAGLMGARFSLAGTSMVDGRADCQTSLQSPTPAASPAKILGFVETLGLGPPVEFRYALEPPYLVKYSPAYGWNTYHVMFQPDETQRVGNTVEYHPWILDYSANSEKWLRLMVDPTAIGRLDAAGGPGRVGVEKNR